MQIKTKFYSDGFYQLSTTVDDRIVSVIYSKDTHFDDAERDFKEYTSKLPPVASSQDFAKVK